MKTISGKPTSTKPVSLSKAAKILSKFVSAENGASQAISAYLHRASVSFNELKQFHKELKIKSPRSDKKRKRHRSETIDDRGTISENPTQSVEITQELNNRALQYENKFRRDKFGSEKADRGEENPTQYVEFNREPNGALALAGNEGKNEKHKKKKKKKQKVENREHGEKHS